MKKSLLVYAAMVCNVAWAQQDPPPPAQIAMDTVGMQTMEGNGESVDAPPPVSSQVDEVYDAVAVEVKPEFPGGQEAMFRFMGQNTKYPADDMVDVGVQGRVYLEFVVRNDGSLTDVVVKRGVARQLDEEAQRVVKSMPKWTPAKMNGKPVACKMVLPVQFTLK